MMYYTLLASKYSTTAAPFSTMELDSEKSRAFDFLLAAASYPKLVQSLVNCRKIAFFEVVDGIGGFISAAMKRMTEVPPTPDDDDEDDGDDEDDDDDGDAGALLSLEGDELLGGPVWLRAAPHAYWRSVLRIHS